METKQIKSAQDITGPVARELRKGKKLSQDKFWTRVGIKQSGGCQYEQEKWPIPEPVRMLIYSIYVAGLDLDPSTPAGANKVKKLAKMQAASDKPAPVKG